MTHMKDGENICSCEEDIFLKRIENFFWVEVWYIKAVLKELNANNDVEKLVLTEQFNKGYLEWMKDSTKNIEQYFEQYVWKPIENFKEIDPDGNVVTIEDIVVTDTTWNDLIDDAIWKE